MLHEFFNKNFQHQISFKLLSRIPHYLQKICLSESKTKNDNSPQTQSDKYSDNMVTYYFEYKATAH